MRIYDPRQEVTRALKITSWAKEAVNALLTTDSQATPEEMLALVRDIRAMAKAAHDAMDKWGWPPVPVDVVDQPAG